MRKKKWHENIPAGGVLCKENSSGSIVRIMGKSSLFNGMVMDDCVSRNHFDPDELTPLTTAEIISFLPDLKPVAWGICRGRKISGLSVIYTHKKSAQIHIDSYNNDADFNNLLEVIELYQLPKVDL